MTLVVSRKLLLECEGYVGLEVSISAFENIRTHFGLQSYLWFYNCASYVEFYRVHLSLGLKSPRRGGIYVFGLL